MARAAWRWASRTNASPCVQEPLLPRFAEQNARTAIILQVEDPRGAAAADEIAAMPGVDMLWLGHNDLCVAMGEPGAFDHPDFLTAEQATIAAAKKHGKSAGRLAVDAKQAAQFVKLGYDFVSIAGDVVAAATGLRCRRRDDPQLLVLTQADDRLSRLLGGRNIWAKNWRSCTPCRERSLAHGLPSCGTSDRGRQALYLLNPDRQRADAADEVGVEPHRRSDDLDAEVALQHLLPQDPDLHLGQSVANAAMDAGAEGEMLARLRPPDDEAVGLVDRRLVAIARDVPHHHLVARRGSCLPAELRYPSSRCAACGSPALAQRIVSDTRLGICARVGPHLVDLGRIVEHRHQARRHRVARRVVAAHDQQPERSR